MEEETTIDDVIIEDENVVDDANTTGDVTADEQLVEETAKVEVKDERDDYWKNKSYELERKLGNLTKDIPKIIEESLIKQNESKTKEREYTIAELEAYKLENPEHAPWVEEQKLKIQEKKFRELLNAEKEEQKKILAKQQSESRVLNNPKYADAFVQSPTGQKVFNEKSELAHAMYGYMQDPRVANLPDALEVAAKLAYADMVDKDLQDKGAKLQTLKRTTAKLKQQTMVEGGGVNTTTTAPDPYTQAAERLRKTGSRADAEAAVREYLKRTR